MDENATDPTVARCRENGWVLIVRATAKLLDLLRSPVARGDEWGTTVLGPWYASALFWRPRVALLVNESTLLPVLMPPAPAATFTTRVGGQIATVLAAHAAPPAIVEEELRQMADCRVGTTTNRSVVGVMSDLARLATAHRDNQSDPDLLDLALRLAGTPCGPLYRRNIGPDRKLAAVLRSVVS